MFKIDNIEFPDRAIFLAPMESVTDKYFRLLCKKNGADMVYSEFISSEGFIRDAKKAFQKIDFNEDERPFALQIFGNNVESMVKATQKAEEFNPDIIDINFGCPVKKVVSKNCGSALLKDIPLMLDITEAVVKSTNIPVTVKTRLGWDETNKPIVDVAEQLQDVGIKALAIHGRTRSQMYKGKSNWELIGEIKNNQRMDIPIIGNGDITNGIEAKNAFDEFGVDAIMIGRASIGNPRIFKEVKHYLNTGEEIESQHISEIIENIKFLINCGIEHKGEYRAVVEMRKHYSNFFKGKRNFKPFKLELMEVSEIDKTFEILDRIEKYYNNND